MLSSTAYSQVTKNVKVSTLKAMAKDIENCEKVIKPELAIKSKKLDSIVFTNLEIFTELKILRIENKAYDKRLKELNEDIVKASKKKNQNWVIPVLAGLSAGIVIGVSL